MSINKGILFDFVEGGRFRFKDFGKIGVLFDPIGESPRNKTDIAVSSVERDSSVYQSC